MKMDNFEALVRTAETDYAASVALDDVACQNVVAMVEMLQDCVRVLQTEGHSLAVDVNEFLARVEKESAL